MEKDIRIRKAEQSVASAKTKLYAAQKQVDEEYKKLSAAYTEVFEEIVCKRGERFIDEEFGIDGYFDNVFVDTFILPTLRMFLPNKYGKPTKIKVHFYNVDNLLEKYSKKQQ